MYVSYAVQVLRISSLLSLLLGRISTVLLMRVLRGSALCVRLQLRGVCQSEGKWRGCATTWLETVSLVPWPLVVACSAKVRREKAFVLLHPFNYKYLAHLTILVPWLLY